MTLKHIIDDAMNFSVNQEVIENATVYTEVLRNSGRQYEYRYSGKRKDLVEAYGRDRLSGMDKYRSPSLSKAYPFEDGWAVNFTFYGLD